MFRDAAYFAVAFIIPAVLSAIFSFVGWIGYNTMRIMLALEKIATEDSPHV